MNDHPHPGKRLFDELKARGIFFRRTSLTRQDALQISRFLGTSRSFWTSLQQDYNNWQSEKGVEMPKVTGEVCPKCSSLTHFEDVEIPVYRELGVPEPPEHYRIEVCPECGWQSEKGSE